VMQVLRSAVDLPAAQNVEGFAVHDENPRRPLGAILAAPAERADVDAFRTAMHRVGPRIARSLKYRLGLDDLVNRRLSGIGLRIDDIDARGAKPGDDQVTPFVKGVASERQQRRRAGVPAEMVELVAFVRHRDGVDDLTEGRRPRPYVD